MNIHQSVQKYFGQEIREHGRERSWEHCYLFFQKTGAAGLEAERDLSSLHLGFYLASWGMLRNSFLLDCTYTVHRGVIELLADDQFKSLWNIDFGADDLDHQKLIPVIAKLSESIRTAYKPFAGGKTPTDTLVTKILIGTLGCFPAFDSYFLKGIKEAKLDCRILNLESINTIFSFCQCPSHTGRGRNRKQGVVNSTL